MDLEDLAPRLERCADRVGPELDRTVQQQARLLRALITENASGRPGPNVITGDYRGSWKVEPFPVPDGGGAEVGTDRPQGRRLEYGFYDMTDSLGRHFFQVPRPHVEPAVNELSPEYRQACGDAVDRIFGGP
ncbi:HK97 gp10 family phage protein [Streptomyces caniscabiei]|uniref:HK97 gp10 family phage protein n=1 Tax=Streptomyces caniscabiei TaxID=2746961 RepID=A0ABU4MYV4_9ACTN|nr:HK97 gp10 family phage protein [Streptomyces caniscabiei]MBE4790352.1 HK97 gp10 family phage protein [Streptomyces caniscabiei]MBE4799545.1 HK97 gp10 family phage protein [Streptomyces caniscabiei]MDX3015210.1 HK97 gp10 family phage protein [Streptomyces caniscabiei]MDX3042525.1 HK97 gp10 family phage protein [Streptomyces caniscabiei]